MHWIFVTIWNSFAYFCQNIILAEVKVVVVKAVSHFKAVGCAIQMKEAVSDNLTSRRHLKARLKENQHFLISNKITCLKEIVSMSCQPSDTFLNWIHPVKKITFFKTLNSGILHPVQDSKPSINHTIFSLTHSETLLYGFLLNTDTSLYYGQFTLSMG